METNGISKRAYSKASFHGSRLEGEGKLRETAVTAIGHFLANRRGC
jgi:hypothetical protein